MASRYQLKGVVVGRVSFGGMSFDEKTWRHKKNFELTRPN